MPNQILKNTGEIILYQSKGGKFSVDVKLSENSVWLTQKQMAEVFDVKIPTINEHIKTIFQQRELKKSATIRNFRIVQNEGGRTVDRLIDFYNLDMIISVGYRINSKRATQFRIWATNILKNYLIKGYALNQKRLQAERLNELEGAIKLIKGAMDTKKLTSDEQSGLLKVITDYANSWVLLQQYDENRLESIQGQKKSLYKLAYQTIKKEIEELKINLIKKKEASDLFARERHNALEGIIGNIYQTFGGKELYGSVEEKAAHLLYFVIKDHPFTDGNKRIGSFLFILFLARNHCLFTKKGQNKITDNTLVALALLVAESHPKQKDLLIRLIVHLIAKK